MDNLESLRKEMDAVDAQMAALFERRMQLSREIAVFKAAHGLGAVDPSREEEIIRQGSAVVGDPDVRAFYVRFQKNVLALSREWQQQNKEKL